MKEITLAKKINGSTKSFGEKLAINKFGHYLLATLSMDFDVDYLHRYKYSEEKY